MATLALAGAQPAQAIVFWDEVTLYLTHATYNPGNTVDTTFYFGSRPAVDLSSFDFTLTWDNALATPVASGPGSVAEWTAALSSKGNASYGQAGPQVIKGGWTADPLGGSASFISTSYSNLKWAVFAFETSPALNVPFVVSIELTNIKDSTGDVMDLGSGFINWATITPVPEPAGWAGLLCGLAMLTRLRNTARS
ncbi:hypothetical protein [Roseateles sp. LKC17W]|uniref:PEP-CTERM sorting domain-containing protein n=1 Tax=Pelomonas margarita TaxID=3299031 RepID=A0ABW7FQC7_9BURK